jgi:hypothetical protein
MLFISMTKKITHLARAEATHHSHNLAFEFVLKDKHRFP